jgi:hypothetical protein
MRIAAGLALPIIGAEQPVLVASLTIIAAILFVFRSLDEGTLAADVLVVVVRHMKHRVRSFRKGWKRVWEELTNWKEDD